MRRKQHMLYRRITSAPTGSDEKQAETKKPGNAWLLFILLIQNITL